MLEHSTVLWALKWLLAFMAFRVLHKTMTRRKGIPTRWPILGESVSSLVNVFRIHEWVAELMELSGGTFRFTGLWINERVVTSHPQNIQHIVKTNFDNYGKGQHFRNAMAEILGDSVLYIDGDRFNILIRMLAEAFGSSSFRRHSVLTAQKMVTERLLPEIKRAADGGVPVDLQTITLPFSLSSISIACAGIDPACLRQEPSNAEFLKEFERGIYLSALGYIFPKPLWKLMDFLGVGPPAYIKKSKGIVWGWINNGVRLRSTSLDYTLDDLRQGRPMDVLSAFLLLANNFSETPPEPDAALSLILAGKDTVNVSLLWMFWILHSHPKVQEKVVDELRKIIRSRGGDENKQSEDFTVEEVKKMNYLQAVLSETLRLYPPVPFEICEAAKDDVLPDGTFVKGGSSVSYSIYSLGRTKELWGDDASEFRPERWLKEHDGRYGGRSEFKFMAFNAGPRRCQGRELANLLVKWAAASVLRSYKIEVVPGHRVAPKMSLTLAMRYGLRVYVKSRPDIMESID